MVLLHLPCRTKQNKTKQNLVCQVSHDNLQHTEAPTGLIHGNGLFSKYWEMKASSAHKKKEVRRKNLPEALRFPEGKVTQSRFADLGVKATHLPAPDQLHARIWCWKQEWEEGGGRLVWCPRASWIGNFDPVPTFLLGETNSNNPAPREHDPGPGSLLAAHPLRVWLLPRLSAPFDTPTEMPKKHTDAQSRRGWSHLFCEVTKVTAQAWWLPATRASPSLRLEVSCW